MLKVSHLTSPICKQMFRKNLFLKIKVLCLKSTFCNKKKIIQLKRTQIIQLATRIRLAKWPTNEH
jgi:hypothetical protein